MGLTHLLPASLRHRWEQSWQERKEKHIGQAANHFLDYPAWITKKPQSEIKRLVRAFSGAPRGPISVAWMLTCQEDIQKHWPALLPQYHKQLLASKQCTETLAILVRRRPQGYRIEDSVIDRIIALDNGKECAQRELLSVLVMDAMDRQDPRDLVRFLGKVNRWILLDQAPYPDATLIKHLSKEGQHTPLAVMEDIIVILAKCGLVETRRNEAPVDYLLGQACWAVDGGIEVEGAIDALLAAGVHWKDMDNGSGPAAGHIRQHPAWRREHLLEKQEGNPRARSNMRRKI